MIMPSASLQVKSVRPERLSEADWDLWSRLQESNADLSSPYFHPEFTQAVASVRNDVEVGILEENGETVGFFPFQRRRFQIGKPVGGRLSDFHGAVIHPDFRGTAAAILHGCGLCGWDFTHLPVSQTVFASAAWKSAESPWIDVSDGFESYLSSQFAGGRNELKHTLRKSRKIGREVGPLSLEWQSADPNLLSRMMDWKSQQYLHTGMRDVFSFAWTRRLLQHIQRQHADSFSGVLSVLRAGDEIVAIHFGMRSRGVLHYWFPAFDPRYKQYSPGVLLLLEIIKAASARGLSRIDLGKGDDHYKKQWANGATSVAEGIVETPSLLRSVRQSWRRTSLWMKTSPFGAPARISARLIRPLREWLSFR